MEVIAGLTAGLFMGLVIGLLTATHLRDKQWRAAARHGRRMESGGRLYLVKKETTLSDPDEE